jgi:branched-chain amino acid transport system substrate-binding protein
MAVMPILFEKNIPHLFPLTNARLMHEPLHKLKFSLAATYYDQVRLGLKYLVKQKGLKRVCTIYQDDEYGQDIMEGGAAALKELGMSYVERTTYKRGATDFASQVARMKDANCEIVVLGTIIRETVGTIATARKLGWNPEFIGQTATYFDIIHKLGGPAMNGLYAGCTVNYVYADDPSRNVRDWFARYKEKYKDDPTILSVYGYQIISNFAAGLEKAGQNLTVESLVKGLEAVSLPRDMFGADEVKFSATKHQASSRAKLCQIVNGRWVTQTDYLAE